MLWQYLQWLLHWDAPQVLRNNLLLNMIIDKNQDNYYVSFYQWLYLIALFVFLVYCQ